MNGVCGDNRFEIITKVKEHLIKATNIEMQPEELKYADSILFRLWQLGYFGSVEKISKLEEQVEKMKFDAVKEAFRQGKVIQYNLDGKWVDWSEPTFDDEPCNYRIKED